MIRFIDKSNIGLAFASEGNCPGCYEGEPTTQLKEKISDVRTVPQGGPTPFTSGRARTHTWRTGGTEHSRVVSSASTSQRLTQWRPLR